MCAHECHAHRDQKTVSDVFSPPFISILNAPMSIHTQDFIYSYRDGNIDICIYFSGRYLRIRLLRSNRTSKELHVMVLVSSYPQ